MNSFQIPALDKSQQAALQLQMDQKLKPVGSLGELERLAIQLRLILKGKSELTQPELLLFAADHGIAQRGVSVAPQAVTALMVEQFTKGRAAINALCESNLVALTVINAGVALPVPECVIQQSLGQGTADFSIQPAMSLEQASKGIELGAKITQQRIDTGCDCLLLGEMGIGNTTSAAAIFAALTGSPPELCVGAGTGVADEIIVLKQTLIRQALTRLPAHAEPLMILAEVGGFEIAQMTGAILAAAEKSLPVILDGFITTASAMLAMALNPACRDYLIFSHQSGEKAHPRMLQELQARPLLQLGLRLGEGSGAVLAMPLLRSALRCFEQMGSLADVGMA